MGNKRKTEEGPQITQMPQIEPEQPPVEIEEKTWPEVDRRVEDLDRRDNFMDRRGKPRRKEELESYLDAEEEAPEPTPEPSKEARLFIVRNVPVGSAPPEIRNEVERLIRGLELSCR